MPLPLAGRRVIVTRASEQAGATLARLAQLGADAVALPTIAIAPPADPAPLARALADLSSYSGFIFTSVNGVSGFFDHARQIGVAPAPPPGSWICAIGPATAAALAQHPGWRPHIAPQAALAEGVVAALTGLPLAGAQILMPRAAQGRDLIPQALARRCAIVVTVETHRTLVPLHQQAAAQATVASADAILFTSSSTARNLAELLGADYRARLQAKTLAALGPITRATLEGLGLAVAVQAPQAALEALLQALADFYA